MAVELATAYVNLTVSTRDLASDVKKSLGAVDTQKSGGQLGDGLLSGIGRALKGGAIAVGATAAAGIGTALFKGMERLDALDQATAKLSGLGHSAETVDTIMNNALASVRGTAFGMGEAATTAAGAVAAGIKPGADLERTLKAVADASTIAGTDMGSMGAIFNKVAASNKVQMDTINQLHDAGVPALALLADEMGVTAEEASKMASAGEIDFATFQSAMESGMGGAALESGATFSGAMDNMMAALGRVGANLLTGIFPQMKDGIGGITEFLAPMEEKAKEVGAVLGQWVSDHGPKVIEVLKGIAEFGGRAFAWVADNIGLLKGLAIAVGLLAGGILVYRGVVAAIALPMQIATAAQIAWNLAMSLNPIGLIITAIVALVAGLIWFFTQTELGQQIWSNFTTFLTEAWANIQAVAVTVFTAVAGFFTGIWESIVSFVTDRINLMRAVITMVVNAVSSVWSSVWNGIVSFFTGVWNNIVGTVQTIQGVFSTVFNAVSGIITGAFEGVVNTVKGVINGIINLINGVIGGINNLIGTAGAAVGIEIAIPTIPQLANGAVVQKSRGGSIVNVGEGRYDEAVVPLGGPQFTALADALAARGGAGTPGVTQYITMTDQDPRIAGRQMGRELIKEMAGSR